MAFVIADRVRETTTTTGTGAVTLAGAYISFQSFSAAIGNGNSTYYTIANAATGEWEVGVGTYTSSGNTLSRDTVLASSNSGSLVTFSTGTKDVFVTQPAERSLLVNSASNGLFSGSAAFTANGAVYATSTSALTTGTLPAASGGTGLTSFTANGVVYASSSSALATGSALTFDGTTLGTNKFSATGDAVTSSGLRVLGSYTVNAANQLALQNSAGTGGLYINGSSTGSGNRGSFAIWLQDSAGANYINPYAIDSSGNSIWSPAGSEQMRLTSTGLGIGTTSPGAKLEVNAGTNTDIRVNTSGSGYLQLGQFTNGAFIGTSSSSSTTGVLRFGTAGTAQVWLDTSGRLLIGTSSASGSNLLQVNSDALINGLTVGRGAGSVSSNTAVGYQAGYSNTTGTHNLFQGYQAAYYNTTGSDNTALGYGAYGWNTGAANATGNYNTAVGSQALAANTTASSNTAVGYLAGYNNTTGSSNFYGGFQSGYSNSTGANNVAIGPGALYSNATSYNIGIGNSAMYYTTTGVNNTAIGGGGVLYNNTSGSYIAAYGFEALFGNTTGAYNTAYGAQALRSNTTGTNNTAVGYQAIYSNQTGSSGTAMGYQAGYSSTSGNPTAFGYQALLNSTTGADNSAFGVWALRLNTTGSYNVGIGREALYSNTTASNNTAVGYQAGYTQTTATRNTSIGYQAGYTTNDSYNVFVGSYAGGLNTGNSNAVLGDYALVASGSGSANVAIGQSAMFSNTTGNYNIGIGYSALYSNTTGSVSVAIGNSAGYSSTFGGNVYIGSRAGYYNTSGGGNTFVGGTYASYVGYSNTTGSYNTALGTDALQANTTASYNTAVGFQAAYNNTTGSNNTVLGYQAGYSNSTGGRNTYLGMYAGYAANLTSSDAGNTYVGYQSGFSTTTGAANTFLGGNGTSQLGSAGHSVTTGSFNTFLGVSSGYYVTTGSKNTILGSYNGNQGGLDIRTASNYIVLSDGDGNPRQIIDSSGNVGLGVTPSAWTATYRKAIQINTFAALSGDSYYGMTDLSNNAYESSTGTWKYTTSAPASDYRQDNNGKHIWYTAPSGTAGNAISFTQAMTLDASGYLLIGTSSTLTYRGLAQLQVYNSATIRSSDFYAQYPCLCLWSGTDNTGGLYVEFKDSSGNNVGSITRASSTTVAYNTSSDYRLKDNQQPLTGSGAFIDALKPKTWDWKADGKRGVGFIAHEVQEVSTGTVVGKKDAVDADGKPVYQAMEYGSGEFIANIVAELQSLRARVAQLESR